MNLTFRKEIVSDLNTAFKSMGLKKGTFAYLYSDDGEAILSVSVGGRRTYDRGTVALSVFVGVGIRSVNRLFIVLNEYSGKKEAREDMFIVGTNIGYVMPQNSYKEWVYSEDAYSCGSLDDIIQAVRDYAFPYLANRNSLEKLIHYVYETHEIGTLIRRDEYYPIMLYLTGCKAEAAMYVKDVVRSGRHTGIDGDNYKRFADNFVAFLAHDNIHLLNHTHP